MLSKDGKEEKKFEHFETTNIQILVAAKMNPIKWSN